MSGICGVWQRDHGPLDQQILRQMVQFLEYRGRDRATLWQEGSIGLGHTLLHCHEDSDPDQVSHLGSWTITADVRLDNRRELVQLLQEKKCPVTAQTSDSLLILHAYACWQRDCLDYLLGDFAFALWDASQQQLWCVRDPLGVKLFYYALVGSEVVWSNTLKAVRVHPRVSRELNEGAIADFLLFDLNYTPDTTVFKAIQRLPPGHTLTLTPTQCSCERYWTLPVPELLRYRRDEEYLEQYQFLMNQAVTDRLRRRTGAIFLSGGLDSTMIAQTALNAAPGGDYRAFTVVYPELLGDREGDYAQIVADSLHLPIEYISADHYTLYQGWETPQLHPPEPYNIPFLNQDYDLYQRVWQQSPVVLYGQGGDEGMRPSPLRELVQGMPLSDLLRDLGRTLWVDHLKPPLGTGILGKLRRRPTADPWADYPPWLNPQFEQAYHLRDRWRAVLTPPPSNPHPWRSQAYQDLLQPLWWANFEATDGGFSQVPVEVRFPCLDLRLLNYLLALSPLPWFINKYLLRQTLQKHVPPTIWQRPKTPLSGHPFYVRLQQGARPWEVCTTLEEIKTYVDVPTLLRVTQNPHLDIATAWSSLRPVSLGYWLTTLQRNCVFSPIR